jgi:GWxTD domain-containing protein
MHGLWHAAALVATAVAVSAGAQGAPAGDGETLLRAVRSYRGQHRTQVDVFVQVPYRLLDPAGVGPEDGMIYRVGVRVTDSTGLTLLRDSWVNHAPAIGDRSDASGVEIVQFSVAPGRYRLTVEVQDSVSKRTMVSAAEIEGFGGSPGASDLLLSSRMRLATPSDSVPQPGELRWGQVLLTASPELELTPLRARAYYLLEAYSPDTALGKLELIVKDSTGATAVKASPSPVQVAAGGGVLHGALDLTGLPPGRYSMHAVLRLNDATIERTATFVMHPVGETLEKEVARQRVSRESDEGYFASLNDEALIAAAEPLQVVATSDELTPWSRSLSVAGKRNFLLGFWKRRDPTPDTPANEARQDFYKKVEQANRDYKESGRGMTSGWRTDRGRIFLRNGVPDEVYRQGAHGSAGRLQSRALPYEVWRFTSTGKDRYYIFVDRTGLGTFSLVRSNDLKENGQANWNEFFSQEDLDDITRFLGRDVIR